MYQRRTDLADEAKELFEASAEKTTTLEGVRARQYGRRGCSVTAVDVLDHEGSRAIGKPMGRYLTVELRRNQEPSYFPDTARCIAEELRRLMPRRTLDAPVLIAGLGNRDITPDAIGPQVTENILITRHLQQSLPELFSSFAPVCAISTGVLGTTGVESAEMIHGVVQRIRPAYLIVVDALVSRKMERLCATVQLSNTGLIPGSGVGNYRNALNEDTLHVPVLSVGVPTVIEAATLAADLLEESGAEIAEEPFSAKFDRSVIVTPKDIDSQVKELSRLIGYGINLALQPDLTVEDITAFLG